MTRRSRTDGPSIAVLVDDLLWWIGAGNQPTGIQRVVSELLTTAAARDDVDIWPATARTTLGRVWLAPVAPERLRWDRQPDPPPRPLKAIAKRVLPSRVRHTLRQVEQLVRTFRTPQRDVDALVVAGAFWLVDGSSKIAKLARTTPVSVLVYDLIPLRYPQWFDRESGLAFRRALDTVLPVAERIVTLSSAASADLVDMYPDVEGRVTVAVPTLAAHTPRVAAAGTAIASPFIVAVGTVEPRKNHLLILDAWRIARRDARLTDASLVIVGRHDTQGERIEAAIGSSENVRRVDAATDQELEALYRDCAATVHASVAEGFGLPARESVARGIPTLIATSIPSDGLPVGTYESFDPTDAPRLAELIVEVLVNPRRDAAYVGTGETGWEPVLSALVD